MFIWSWFGEEVKEQYILPSQTVRVKKEAMQKM
jgi:hypothetical protein